MTTSYSTEVDVGAVAIALCPLYRKVSYQNSTMIMHETPNAFDSLFQLFSGGAVGAAHVALARRAECAARHHRHPLLEEQLLGEVIGTEAGASNRGEGVERAVRLIAGQPLRVEASHDQLAPLIIAG